MNIQHLDADQVIANLRQNKNSFYSQYKAFYSTWLGGLVTDPALMILPMDDHMVHRGDAVFEAIKFINRRVFLLEGHLERLYISAAKIGISPPLEKVQMKELLLEILKKTDQSTGLIRLFVSRGPGGYTTNPYDSVGAQIYVTITELKPPKPESFQKGVRIGRSEVAIKEGWMAQVKSCNYLPNVMMKKESVDRGLDFTVTFDEKNFLAESSTENIALISEKGEFVYPPFDRILKGTTLLCVAELARKMGLLVSQRNISEGDLLKAREVFMIGTTLDILPVVEYEGQKIGSGAVGPLGPELLAKLREFQRMEIAF